MNKFLSIALLTAFASTAALAQAPAGTTPRTSAEQNATTSGGMPAAKAEMKTDAKKDGTMAAKPMSSGTKHAIDTNGDGMISQAEWNAYHGGMWKKMKRTKGMASTADYDAMMKAGGPN